MTILATLAISVGTLSSAAAAHERRTVGPYTFVVGWLVEPSFVGEMNALDLTVTETSSSKPLDGLEKTLQAEIVAGGNAATLTLPLAARFGLAGRYQAQVLPTRPGDYTFHIFGTAGSTKVDERFESGPGRFGSVETTSAVQFPAKQVSADDLSTRLDEIRSVGIAGVALGGIALAVGLAGLLRGRRPAAADSLRSR
ncbi:MAG: hypothetical protein ABR525_01505 [Candidatus Limnocylindria bacterium]